MTKRSGTLVAAAIAAMGCGGRAHQATARPLDSRGGIATDTATADHPPLEPVVREGDTRGAIAIAVSTDGIAEDRGALVGVALAALVQERLAVRGIDATATGGWGGWRLRALAGSPPEASKIVDAAREALVAPVADDEPALAAVARKASALARRPLPDRALVDAARCTGEAFGMGEETAPTAAELESWRAAAHGLGRVGIAVAGEAPFAAAVAWALRREPSWPRAAPIVLSPWPGVDARTAVYEASGEISPGAARVVVTARTASAERAVGVAPALGDPRGALASRLNALEAPARIRSVVATAHVDGGCVAITIDLDARDLTSAASAPARIATAAALVRQALAVEIEDGTASPDLPGELARRAADPREAAERAAWWSLAGKREGVVESEPRLALTVGVAAARDSAEAVSADAIRSEIDRATFAWHAPIVEARTSVERGQGESWLLLASTCGTFPEGARDAGLGAAVALAAAAQARDDGGSARVEPFVTAEGVGILLHGPARAGESSQEHARRLADMAGRAFAAVVLDPPRITHARALLLARAGETDARVFATLGGELAPGHPSWLVPEGTMLGLSSTSDDAVAARGAAMRGGPLRVAVIANSDLTQAGAAVRAVDRWIARRPGEARVCPSTPAVPAARAGTYAVELPMGAASEAFVTLPLKRDDAATRTLATWLAATLDGPDGLLERSLGAARDGRPDAPLARAWSAGVIGPAQAPALVIRLVTADGSLDRAVAQVRALLDRVRQGALRDTDRARAEAYLTRSRLAAGLDPRERLVELWHGRTPPQDPSLEDLRLFASASVRDEDLVIVAARPPRPGSARR